MQMEKDKDSDKEKASDSGDEKIDTEDAEVLDEQPKNLLLNLISQLRVGMDLSKVTLPTFILEPRSFLEKLGDFLTHADLLTTVPTIEDPFERFVAILRWYLSGFYLKPKGVKKPYNPILGEYYRCRYDTGSTKTYYYAEQVSHHPPISCFYVSNRKAGIVVNGCCLPRSKFLGNSAASILDGTATIFDLKHNEDFSITFPSAYARGILFGTLLMELVGPVVITCEKHGFRAELEFKARGFFGGEYNKIEGKVKDRKGKTLATISGKWDGQVEFKRDKKKEILFDPKGEYKPTPRILPTALGDTESPKLWSNVSKAIRAGDQIAATEAKTILEEAQREAIKKRKEKNDEYQPRLFHKTSHQWAYKELNTNPWDSEKEEEELEDNGKIYSKLKGEK